MTEVETLDPIAINVRSHQLLKILLFDFYLYLQSLNLSIWFSDLIYS